MTQFTLLPGAIEGSASTSPQQVPAILQGHPSVALSARQPWAWFIVHGFKDIENRDWATKFRGPVLIHASKWFQMDEMLEDLEFCAATFKAAGHKLDEPLTLTLRMMKEQSGGIVGQTVITDCVRASPSPWFFGKYGFALKDSKPLPFTPLKGALGFFRIPDDQKPQIWRK